MSIVPLPVFEADADPRYRGAMSDEEIYARLETPKTIVVRFGRMNQIGEYPYDGQAKPGCGTKLVARTHRGTELTEMLTTTCENAGCSKSVTRQEMLEYIQNSGGSDFPFSTDGRILRVATIEDLNKQSGLEPVRKEGVRVCKALIAELALGMKLIEAEPILGGELMTFYFMSEQRVDFRELVRRLASQFHTRIEMKQVGARDEARLVADYERCGQYCCCKGFLKVLKPVSMKSAKVQKATLDPLKISGRCGRLMCCLRYEDQTYKELGAKLPKRGKRVGTSEGPGVVVDAKILVQLALVRLDHNGEEIAVPIEQLLDPETCPQPGTAEFERRRAEARAAEDPLRGMDPSTLEEQEQRRSGSRQRDGRREGKRESEPDRARPRSKADQQDSFRSASQRMDRDGTDGGGRGERRSDQRERDQRSGRPRGGGERGAGDERPDAASIPQPPAQDTPGAKPQAGQGGRRKRRRRRRRRGGSPPGSPPGSSPDSPPGSLPGAPPERG